MKGRVPAQQWSTLRVDFSGDRFDVSLNGEKLFSVEDSTFRDAGHVGVWTKADSITLFDDFACAQSTLEKREDWQVTPCLKKCDACSSLLRVNLILHPGFQTNILRRKSSGCRSSKLSRNHTSRLEAITFVPRSILTNSHAPPCPKRYPPGVRAI